MNISDNDLIEIISKGAYRINDTIYIKEGCEEIVKELLILYLKGKGIL